jgi:hypothetical protein
MTAETPPNSRTPPSAVFVASISILGTLVGLVLGAVLGGVLYEVVGPPWAQFGVEFEGMGWALQGALWGGAVSLGGTLTLALKARFDGRRRRRLGAAVGVFLGTAAGLAAFPPTAPGWVLPVITAALIGAGVGGAAGARLAVVGFGPPPTG